MVRTMQRPKEFRSDNGVTMFVDRGDEKVDIITTSEWIVMSEDLAWHVAAAMISDRWAILEPQSIYALISEYGRLSGAHDARAFEVIWKLRDMLGIADDDPMYPAARPAAPKSEVVLSMDPDVREYLASMKGDTDDTE